MCRYKVKIVALIGFIVLLALLLWLGFWQLSRAEEKREFLANQTIMIQKKPQSIGKLLAENKPVRYRRVIAEGHYDVQHQILLDNQIYQGKVGYLVLTPFILAHEQKTVLVNRGWVLMDKDRSKLPSIDFIAPAGKIKITGVLNEFPQVGLVLEGADQPSEDWPIMVQIINKHKIASKLGRSIVDYQLQLVAEEPYGYVRDWQVHTRILPEKHTAYAFQWFALAATLTLLILWINCKIQKHD